MGLASAGEPVVKARGAANSPELTALQGAPVTRTWGQEEIRSPTTAGPGEVHGGARRSPPSLSKRLPGPRVRLRPSRPGLSARGHQRAPLSTESARPALRTALSGSRVPRGRSPSPAAPTDPARPPPPSFLPLGPSRTLLQPRGPPCCFPDTAGADPPQGLGTRGPRLLALSLWGVLSPHSDLSSNVACSERPPLTSLAQEAALSLFAVPTYGVPGLVSWPRCIV